MNVEPADGGQVTAAVWESQTARELLAARDVRAIYEFLQRMGVSQRRIAALTGQSQSEISEILSGQRQVMAYDLLVRIADGLSIPRGYMGLAYDETTAEMLGSGSALAGLVYHEPEEVRQLLAHAAEVTIGAAVSNVDGWWQPVERTLTPAPGRIGESDVAYLEAITGVLRATDYQYGGGACRDAVTAQVRWAQRFLASSYSQGVGRRLHLALGDLHNLAAFSFAEPVFA